MNSKTPALATPLIRVILRLWCHECTRVFSDRLIGEDELWFSSTLRSIALEHFCKTSLESPEEGINSHCALIGQYHEKNHSSTFNLNRISFENKPSRQFQFLNIFFCSRDIHLLKQANENETKNISQKASKIHPIFAEYAPTLHYYVHVKFE